MSATTAAAAVTTSNAANTPSPVVTVPFNLVGSGGGGGGLFSSSSSHGDASGLNSCRPLTCGGDPTTGTDSSNSNSSNRVDAAVNSSKSPPILLVSMVPQHHHTHSSSITNSSTASRTSRYVHTTTHPVRHLRSSYTNGSSSGSSSSNNINNNNHSNSSGAEVVGPATSHFAYSNGTLRLVAPANGSNHRFMEESSGRPIKFVTATAAAAAANHHAYNHIPNAIQPYQQQQSNRVAANQALAATTTNKRTYATIPLTRAVHQQHGTSTSYGGYAKEMGSSYAPAATLGGGGSGSGPMPAKGHIYYNMPYASSIGGVRGQKLDFKDRNGFVHNMSYHLTTTTAAAHGGDPVAPKRSWSEQAGPRGINGREWGQPTGRQQYALVSTTMTP